MPRLTPLNGRDSPTRLGSHRPVCGYLVTSQLPAGSRGADGRSRGSGPRTFENRGGRLPRDLDISVSFS